MGDEKLDLVIEKLAVLSNDMQYVKKYMEENAKIPMRVSLLELSVRSLNRIAWKIGTVCGVALLGALLGLIL